MLSEMIDKATVMERKVKPVGKLLNDNDSGVDQLGYLVYAQALSKLLHNCNPPISIGIFGPWGIGKTFLLKHVQCLLRKYEEQEKYDSCLTPQDSLTNYTEEDGIGQTSNQRRESTGSKPYNRTRTVNLRRACVNHCAALAAFLLFAIICAALLVLIFCFDPYEEGKESEDTHLVLAAIRPVLAKGRSLDVAQEKAGNGSGASSYVTTSSTNIAISGTLRIQLIVLLVILTGMVFGVFCCCVSNTGSKFWSRLRSNYMLTLYAAFTRLPTVTVASSEEWYEPNNPYLITHFNDERAILSYDPGDEENIRGVRISSREVRKLPKRYVFVNYHAWQYAGSDTLWAGIVTKLSDALEEEFGAVCVRTFRMLQVERPSKSGPIKIGFTDSEDPRCLYVRFRFPPDRPWTSNSRREKVLFVMKEFGVVTECFSYRNFFWWYVRYSTDKEAEYAAAALRLDNFDVRRNRPNIPEEPSNTSCAYLQEPTSETESPLVYEETICGDRFHTKNNPSFDPVGKEANFSRKESFETEEASCVSCSGSCCRFLRHFRRHPKTVCCGCPFLYCCFFFITAALIFPITLLILVDHLKLELMKSSFRVIPIEVQVLSWMPATLGVLVVVFRFCWAMCHSQTDRIRRSLAGSRGNMKNALGFMNEVKREVMIMSRLINCIRFTHGVDYKIVLTIDDLDRCPYHKVKSVLEAVNILLSDRSSPFLCLIAVDSRVAVKCIEQDMGEVLLQANLTGHEYLKKIINLPFCLPEVSSNAKKKYFGGVLDAADETKLIAKPCGRNSQTMNVHLDGGDDGILLVDDYCQTDAAFSPLDKLEYIDNGTSTDGGPTGHIPRAVLTSCVKPPVAVFKDYSEFLFHCRQILNGVGPVGKFIHEYLYGNPRNMKRIFNVLSLTTHLLECIEERRKRIEFLSWHRQGYPRRASTRKDRRTSIINSDVSPKRHALNFGRHPRDAEDLIKWIVAADQWPYRVSYILQVVEDLDNRWNAGTSETMIEESCTLFEIYEKYVEPEIEDNPGAISMLTLDNDPAALRGFLRRSTTLTRGRISFMFPFTVNLDQSLRNGISRQRAMPKECNCNLAQILSRLPL